MPLCLHKIVISHFRSHTALRLDLAGAPFVVLAGPNGSGKTNILEAISLLTPGKGMRGADLFDIKSKTAAPEEAWAVSADIETATGDKVKVGTGLDLASRRRLVRIDGRDVKSQNELSYLVSAVWLTPQMDRLFQDSAAARRKFFDRLVLAYEPGHAARLNRYDRNLRERMKLLLERAADATWLAGLETQLASDAVAIAASRLALLENLALGIAEMERRESLFPSPLLSLTGWAEGEIGKRPALDIEEELKARFEKSRSLDQAAGKTHEGIHRTDLLAFYRSKDMQAAQSSTGEQKALLVAILLSHAHLMRLARGHTPLLLLDEALAHLDDARRLQLFAFLTDMKGQVFLTGTNAEVFAPLRDAALFIATESGSPVPRKPFKTAG